MNEINKEFIAHNDSKQTEPSVAGERFSKSDIGFLIVIAVIVLVFTVVPLIIGVTDKPAELEALPPVISQDQSELKTLLPSDIKYPEKPFRESAS